MNYIKEQYIRDRIVSRIVSGKAVFLKITDAYDAASQFGITCNMPSHKMTAYEFIHNAVCHVINDVIQRFEEDSSYGRGMHRPIDHLRDLWCFDNEITNKMLSDGELYDLQFEDFMKRVQLKKLANAFDRLLVFRKKEAYKSAASYVNEYLGAYGESRDEPDITITKHGVTTEKTLFNSLNIGSVATEQSGRLKSVVSAMTLVERETQIDVRPAFEELIEALKSSGPIKSGQKFGDPSKLSIVAYQKKLKLHMPVSVFESMATFIMIHSDKEIHRDVNMKAVQLLSGKAA